MNAKVYIKTNDGQAYELKGSFGWTYVDVLSISSRELPDLLVSEIKELTIKPLSGSTQETDGAAASTPSSS